MSEETRKLRLSPNSRKDVTYTALSVRKRIEKKCREEGRSWIVESLFNENQLVRRRMHMFLIVHAVQLMEVRNDTL